MTAAELIEFLRTVPADVEILCPDDKGGAPTWVQLADYREADASTAIDGRPHVWLQT